MTKRILVACVLVVGPGAAHAVPLDVVHVSSPAINCVFDADCGIFVEDTTDHFTIGPTVGDAFLQSRTFPPGEPGTAAEGLYAYLYRLDLRQLAAVTAPACVSELAIVFGPTVPLDYDGSGDPDHVFVVTAGGLGSVAPSSAEQVGATITFRFAPPVCAGAYPGGGETSYFFGLTSAQPPRAVVAQIRDTLGGTTDLEARAPEIPTIPPIDIGIFRLEPILRQQERLWQDLRQRLGERWRVQWNPVTGTPHRISGGALEVAKPNRENVDALSREVLLRYRQLLRIDPEQLVLSRVDHQPPRAGRGGTGTWLVFYQQEYQKVLVEGGSARVVIRGGKLTSFGSDFYPGVELSTEPRISPQQAVAELRRLDRRYRRQKPVARRLIVFPKKTATAVRYHLAWDLTMPVVREPRELVDPAPPEPPGRREPKDEKIEWTPAQWRYLVDAHSGALIERQNVMDYEDASGTVIGSVHPQIPADPPETRPISQMTVTVTQGGVDFTAETDLTGSYLIPGLAAGAATLEAHFEGPHIRVWNNETPDPDATHAAAVTVPGAHDWDWSADDPSPADVETSAFWHLNRIRDYFLSGTPFDVSPNPDPMPVYVRNGPYCNASAGVGGLSFASGIPGTCEDFALCSDIVYHEYTHRVVRSFYGDGSLGAQPGAMKEGWADYFGASINDDSWVGVGCYRGRDLEPDKRFPDDWVGEVHDDGKIHSGALWDLRAALGAEYVDGLAMWGMKELATTFSEYLGVVLAWDDDSSYNPDPAANDDPTDGTPNVAAICDAYWDLHGIFHPDCAGYTADPVAVITDPPLFTFNLFDATATAVPIAGTALGSATQPLAGFILEYAHEGDPTTWLVAGMTLVGGGTVPVANGPLGELDLTGLTEDGVYLIRLTVTDAAATTAVATTAFVLDRALLSGWPQVPEARFYGSPAIADLDPAHPGLEVAGAGTDGFLYVWHADGTAAPAVWPQWVDYSRSAPAVADLDADGTLEVVLANAWGHVWAFHQDGTLLPGWPVWRPSPGSYDRSTTALADLDGDGDLEVVVGSTNDEIFAWHHDGAPVSGWPVAVGGWVESSPAVADLDGDGRPEVVFGANDGQVHVLGGDGTAFAPWPLTIAGNPEVSCSAALGDLDGDGDLEIVVGTAASGTSQVYAWHHDGSAVAGWPQDLDTIVQRPGSVDLADLDGDGELEIVVMTNNDLIHAWEADGTPIPGWPPSETELLGWEYSISSPSIADLDGDLDQEVVVDANFSTIDGFWRFPVYAFHADGSPLAGWPKRVSDLDNSSPAIADLDQDGDVEVVMGSYGMFVWDLDGAFDVDSPEWPLYRHDNLRTGRYGPKAAVVLLFDTSGSMSWAPDGTMGVPEEEQRITFAKAAAQAFLELLNDFNAGKASFGIATFPAHPSSYPWPCNAEVVTPTTVATDASTTTAVTATIPGLVTEDNTPLLAGLRTAAGMLGPEPRKVIVLLSDGYHNCPSLVLADDPEVVELIADLERAGIRVFTIGFGRPTDVDHPLLEALAAGTTPADFAESQFHDVTIPGFDPATWDPWDPATAIQETYKNVLVDALDLETAADPLGILAGGASHDFEVRLNEHDRRVSFFLSWRTPAAGRLGLTVEASDGSAVPTSGPGVRLHEGETYTILTLDRTFLGHRGKVGPKPWRGKISAAEVAAGEREPFQYSVIVDSALRLRPALDRTSYGTGQRITLSARITEAGVPVTGLEDVEVAITGPADGQGNWLATNPVSNDELARVPKQKGSEVLAPFRRKAMYLAEIRKVPLPGLRATKPLRLYDDGSHGDAAAGDGVYTNRFDDTRKEGVYSFHFRARGALASGNGFDRDDRIQTYVAVRAVPERSGIEVLRLKSLRLAAGDFQRFEIRVTPRDTLGNYLGPGRAGALRLRSAETFKESLVGVLRDELDGSYSQLLQVPIGVEAEKVRVQIEIRGETSTFTLAEKLRKSPP